MRVLSLIACVISVGVIAVHVDLPEPFKDECIVEKGINKYNPLNQYNVPWFNVDLDAPPEKRWTHIAAHYKKEIKGLIQVIIDLIVPIFPGALDFIDDMFADVVDKFPTPYREELQSIAVASEMPIGQIVLYNIFYEIFTVCTSTIAQDPEGHVYHARNLDFGLFLGWDYKNHEWQVSSHLRKMVINVNWMKNGKILFKSNNYAGYIGIYNGLKPQAFSVTANERFGLQGGYVGMIRWLLDMEPNGKWMSWLTRETLEQMNSYEEALDHLSNTPMLSPVYYILGGMKPNQGSIITRSLNGTDLLNQLDPSNEETGWYLMQTNYDLNTEPLYLDDRRTPGNNCIKKLTQQRVGFEGIYNVLSSTTNLNKLTTYTVLMSVESGRFETHLQACPGMCWAF